MKKRLLSLVLCLVMVFSLLPVFEAPAMAASAIEYKEASDPTNGSWTVSDINTYMNSSTLEQDSLGNQLYAKVGNEYYPVATGAANEYFYLAYGSNGTISIFGNFTKQKAADRKYGLDNGKYGNISAKGDDESTNYYICLNGDIRTVYYNSYTPSSDHYATTLFVYKGARTSNEVSSKATWLAAKQSHSILMLANNSSTPIEDYALGEVLDLSSEDYSLPEWYYNWKKVNYWAWRNDYPRDDGGDGEPQGVPGAPQLYLKGTKSNWSVNAIYFTNESGTKLGYLAPVIVNSTSDSRPTSSNTPTYSGPLYYQAQDPELFEVTDPDFGEKTVTVNNNTTIWNPGRVNQNGFKLSKELSTEDGESFDLTMQSYSTANTTKFNVVEKVPTDFVVIVDQSGSMDTTDMPTGYTAVSGTMTLEDIANASKGNNPTPYYVKGDDGQYYRVYATRDYLMEYHASETLWTKDIIEDAGYSLSWFQGEDEATFTQDNQYYYKTSDGVYRPISVTARGVVGTYYIGFKYYDENNEEQWFQRPSKPVYKNVFGSAFGKYKEGSLGYGAVNAAVLAAYPNTERYTYSTFLGITTGMYINYPMYTRHVGYTKLSYRDVNGVEHVINPTSGPAVAEYCDSDGNAVTTQGGSTRMNYNKLYTTTGKEQRLDSLKKALTQFVEAVASESDTKNGGGNVSAVDNRIAIVGFSSDTNTTNRYDNTEILTGETFTAGYNNGVQMVDAEENHYATALISATDGTGIGKDHVNSKLTAAINAITANGGTQPEYGFDMAYNILDKRSDKTYTMVSGDKSTKDRNTIVIFFTDGQPGDWPYENQYTEANEVVEHALPIKQLKNAQGELLNTKIFSIGVFGESDGNPLTYSHDSAYSVDSSWKFLGGWVENLSYGGKYYCLRRQWRPNNAEGYTTTANDTIYDYMSVVSSNYPDAAKFIDPNWLVEPTYDTEGNAVYAFKGNYIAATEGAGATGAQWNGDGAAPVVRSAATASATNNYYRMAANQATLVEAFKQSVTYASTQQQSTSSVSLDSTAIFRDTINTTDFDVSNATYSVVWKPIKVTDTADENGSMIAEWNGDDDYPVVSAVTGRAVPADGKIEYSGFNYNANYVSSAKEKGYKLVVTVTGLVPKTYDKEFKSNADTDTLNACGIYKFGAATPEISVVSPKVTILKPTSSYVVDYNVPMIIAHDATINSQDVTNGVFTIGTPNTMAAAIGGSPQSDSPDSQNAIYTLMSFHNDSMQLVQHDDGTFDIDYDPANINITVNGAFSAVDHANITGRHVEDGDNAEVRTRDVYMIPASSIYMSDKTLIGHPAVDVSDGHGYNAQIVDDQAKATTPVLNELYFTFYGTGIDVYCTTDDASGYVQAAVFKGAGKDACVKANRQGKAVTVKNYSATERFNVPSLSFTGLSADTYTLMIYVSGNGTVEAPLYKINGVRIYNPQAANSQAEAMLNGGTYDGTEYDATIDANATYLNLRKLLLNENGNFKVENEISETYEYEINEDGSVKTDENGDPVIKTDENGNPIYAVDISAVNGVLFIDNAANLSTTWSDENGNKVNRYADNFDAYVHDGPKNEIYLDEQQGITFQMDVSKFNDDTRVYLGLSAPETGSGTVLINGTPISPAVNSVMDMYYPVPINLDNAVDNKLSITVTNGGKSLISITNLKITGVEDLLGLTSTFGTSSLSNADKLTLASKAFFAPVTPKTVMFAANDGVDPDTDVTDVVDPEPTDAPDPEPSDEPDPEPTDAPDPEPTDAPDPEPSDEPSAEPTTTPSVTDIMRQLFSGFISSLFGSVSRLFGN